MEWDSSDNWNVVFSANPGEWVNSQHPILSTEPAKGDFWGKNLE